MTQIFFSFFFFSGHQCFSIFDFQWRLGSVYFSFFGMRAWFLAAEDCCSRCTQGSATIAGAALVVDGRSSTSRSTAASTSSDGGSGFDHVEVQPGVHSQPGRGHSTEGRRL